MILRKISVVNYKNIEQEELNFSPNVNCFVGKNGQGKTNMLDAIYYLSFCKSSTNPTDNFNIRHGEEYFMLQGEYEHEDGGTERIHCAVKNGRRKLVKRNGKDLRRLSEHIGKIPIVMISPSDSNIITGTSEERRRFLDSVISQYDPQYLDALLRYNKTLQQRNALLKQDETPDAAVMDVLEEMLSDDALYIYECRKAFVTEIIPLFQEIYGSLSDAPNEAVGMCYQSHCERGALKPQLESWREKERIVGHTLHGVHKDDLLLELNNYAVRREGSQGQTKTYFIAMKLAQFAFLRLKGEHRSPILLLDDIFDKLDDGRVAKIIDFVAGRDFGQIFITDTNREHLDKILLTSHRDYKVFEVQSGKIITC